MKALWIWATFLASTVLSDSLKTSPFYPPKNVETAERAFEVLQILKRANVCPAGYNPCTDLGSSKVCCRDGTNCSRDAADNIACCPTGASCTGSLTVPSTGSSSFMFTPVATTTATSGLPSATVSLSSIAGAPYPFVVIPTTFANAESCSSYYTVCQSEYTACLATLGGRYGVTVAGPSGAGITVPGGGPAVTPVASVCSSLSMQACHGLQLPHCNAYGNSRPFQNIALRRTSVQDLTFGLAVAVAGLFV